jgi:hypothetical protein
MKKIILALSTFLFCSSMQAQFKNTISLNASYPTVQMLMRNAPDSTSNVIPTNIAISRLIKNKILVRLGFGGYTNYQIATSDLSTDVVASNYFKLNAALSFYHLSKSENDKWTFGKGVSVNASRNLNQRFFDSGFDVVEFYNSSDGIGIGPSFFVQYQFSKHVSLYTEYTLAYNLYTTANGKKFSAFPDQNYNSKHILTHGMQFQYPVSLYLNYSF